MGALNAGQANPLPVLSFSPNGQILVSGADGATFTRWEIADPNNPRIVDRPTIPRLESATRIAFSQDGLTLAAGQEKSVRLWDLSDWANPAEAGSFDTDLPSPVSALAFHPDGKVLAITAASQVHLWDVSDPGNPGRIEASLAADIELISSLAFSPDGRLLVMGSCKQWQSQSLFDEDCGLGEVLIWNVPEGAQPRPVGGGFEAHTGTVTALAFHPDQAMLATGSEDRTILLWDLSNPLTPAAMGLPLTAHTGGVASLRFSPDGKILASSDDTGMTYLWSMDPDYWIDRACQQAQRNFTREEWEQFVPDEPYREVCPE
jgi:WD40 repeat protein